MNINGVKTKLELQEFYCFQIQEKTKLKKNIASTRSFGKDVDDFSQLSEAMFSYIETGTKKLKQNKVLSKKVTIFVSGNYHKGNKYHYSKTISLNTPTRDNQLIWSQIYKSFKSFFFINLLNLKCFTLF